MFDIDGVVIVGGDDGEDDEDDDDDRILFPNAGGKVKVCF
jgi:hypothetical protein